MQVLMWTRVQVKRKALALKSALANFISTQVYFH